MNSIQLKKGLLRWSDAMLAAAPELNDLDGRLGDGDLGATLEKCAQNVKAALPTMPEDFVALFKQSAQACAKASGSSFGTLLAVAYLNAAKWVGNKTELNRSDLAELMFETVATLSARGGAKLGDKTMLDSLQAIGQAFTDGKDADPLAEVAREAAVKALDAYREKPNRIGRARMFADRSMGMDDPGMVAVLRMAESLC